MALLQHGLCEKDAINRCPGKEQASGLAEVWPPPREEPESDTALSDVTHLYCYLP